MDNEENFTRNHHKRFHYKNQLLLLLRTPFISDKFIIKLYHLLKELYIKAQVATIPSTNLRQLFMQTRI